VIKTVGYSKSDLDFEGAFGSGFRWSETLTNVSATAWTDFHITLVDTTGTFSHTGDFLNVGTGSAEVPGFALITPGTLNPIVTVLSTLGTPLPVLGWVMNLSLDQREINIDFPTPVLPGQGFQVHVPIENIGDGPGTFVLSQQASAAPEPCNLAVWGALVTIGLGVAWRRTQFA
jgi:hypothetical protein